MPERKPKRGGWRRPDCYRHGASVAAGPEYKAWAAMKSRCINPDHKMYPRYGGRGIRLHPAWGDAATFLAYIAANLGPRPPRHSIDRIDNEGHYEPGNIRWATYQQQNRNRRASRTTGKLTEEDVRQIRERLAAGHVQKRIAASFRVNPSTISFIKTGRLWAGGCANFVAR